MGVARGRGRLPRPVPPDPRVPGARRDATPTAYAPRSAAALNHVPLLG
ncbi:hypothetical protein ACU686_10755 [Yinghuangia aomiensis]